MTIDQLGLKRWVASMERASVQRDLAQAVLRESETRFRQLAENIREVFFLISSDGLQVIYISPAYVELWGRSCESLYEHPMSFLEAIHPDDRPRCIVAFEQPTETDQYTEYRVMRPDGSTRWVGGRTFPICNEYGRVYRVAGIFDDVTEHHQAEEALQRAHNELEQRVAERTAELELLNQALRESQATLARRVDERTADLSAANAKLARAMRLKDEFLASMSHELRTPLNAILSTYEVLHEQIYGPLTLRQTTALEHIETSGRHLLALINDILDLSKIGAGKLELAVSDVSVAALCDAGIQLTQSQALQKGLQFTAQYDPQVTTIQGDARRLKQVLVNLLSNAVKFTPTGGAVGLDVLGDLEAGVVRFTVWDTGIGIETEDQARMFEPFTQLDSGLARQFEGTGLGLALVASMVELHGGGIEVQSTVGQGSRFTLVLPWNEQCIANDMASSCASSTDHQPLTIDHHASSDLPLILVVEDNEQMIMNIKNYLQFKHYRTVIARNGAEAVECAQELQPDLIVMDVQMPGMNGLEATQLIRADATIATTPIIAVTALAMPGDREHCLEAGANVYLSKPVSLRVLVDEIESLLGSRRGFLMRSA